MKTSRIILADWVSTDLYLDIDWPAVHKKLGLEQIDWLLQQPRERVQLVLDKKDINCKLVAEFYDERTLITYHLMWSKWPDGFGQPAAQTRARSASGLARDFFAIIYAVNYIILSQDICRYPAVN